MSAVMDAKGEERKVYELAEREISHLYAQQLAIFGGLVHKEHEWAKTLNKEMRSLHLQASNLIFAVDDVPHTWKDKRKS